MRSSSPMEGTNLHSEEVSKKKKKKKKRVWNEDDELSILKGLVDYRVKTRDDSSFDWDGFFVFVQGSIRVKFSREQLFSKVRKLRRKFLVHMERINVGDDPLFTRLTDSQAFGYSNMIWGEIAQQEDPQEDEQMDNAGHVSGNLDGKDSEFANGGGMENETTFRENGRVGNDDEPVIENGAEKGGKTTEDGKESHDDDDELRVVEDCGKTTNRKESHDDDDADELRVVEDAGKTTDGKESHDDDDDDDELRDAFETTILQGLSDWQRKLQLNKLMTNLGTTGKRKELCNEWKALRSEQVKFNIKKLRFAAKLVEAANDG